MEEKLRSIESEISLAEECTRKQTKDHHPDAGTDEMMDRQMLALDEQERRTRVAFLQNRQAELETEIRLLRSSQLRPADQQEPHAEMTSLTTPPNTL